MQPGTLSWDVARHNDANIECLFLFVALQSPRVGTPKCGKRDYPDCRDDEADDAAEDDGRNGPRQGRGKPRLEGAELARTIAVSTVNM